MNAADYEAEGYTVMRAALGNAKAVLADEKATQDRVDASAAELENAMAKLTPSENATVGNTDTNKDQIVANAGSQSSADGTKATTNTTSTNKTIEKSAKTGDSTAIPAAGMTVLLSGCALAFLGRRRRKET